MVQLSDLVLERLSVGVGDEQLTLASEHNKEMLSTRPNLEQDMLPRYVTYCDIAETFE